VTVFGFIAAQKAEHSVKTMCRVLEVSRSGFHAWSRRQPSARARQDAVLTERILEIHRLNRCVYGSPRIHAELAMADGVRVGRKRVERLMRQAGLSGLVTKKWRATTIRVPGLRVAGDLLDRNFAAGAPNRCWDHGKLDGDAVASFDPQRPQTRGDAADLRVQLGVGPGAGMWLSIAQPTIPRE
jgi:putative transposase